MGATRARQTSSLFFFFKLLLELPATFVIPSVVHELTAVSIAAVPRVFVVLANVWLVVKATDDAHVRHGFGGPLPLGFGGVSGK